MIHPNIPLAALMPEAQVAVIPLLLPAPSPIRLLAKLLKVSEE